MFSRSQSEENICIKYESLSSPERVSSATPTPTPKEESKGDGVSGMDGKRYALRWRHHQSTVVAEVGSLYRDSALVDVTLACEDQRTYQAHKLVLSACSQYFQSLFSRHPAHQHPIIFLKDVRGDECEALLTYMYKGEVSVNQDQIPRILRVASSLQVRGLAEVDPQNSRPSSPTYGDRGAHCGSSSPSPSTGPPTKCATPSSEPQSPNGNAASTPQLGTHSGGHHTDSISTSRHPSSLSSSSLPHHPSHSMSQDFSPYHLLPHPRPPYDPSSILGPLTDPDRKRLDEKPPPHSLVGPYPPPLRVKQDLGGGSNWEGGVDVGGLSPLSLTEGPRPPFLSHAIFSSFMANQEQHMPSVSQGYGRMFPISDPLRRVDRLCSSGGGETRIHKCTFCSRKFKRKDHLKTHIRIHTGERPYKCKICGRGFIQSQQVKIHMKVHVREDSTGSLGAASMLGGSGAPDSRTLSAIYPELAQHYGGDPHQNDRGSRRTPSNNDGGGSSPPLAPSQPESDNEFSSEAPEGADLEAPLRLPPSSSSMGSTGGGSFFQSSTSSSFLPHSSSLSSNNNNNANNPSSPHTTNHSGGRSTPQPSHHSSAMDTSPPDESCGVTALKGGSNPYHISTNFKK